jgi:hypothetical protein
MKKTLQLFCLIFIAQFAYSQLQYDWENWTSVGVKKNFKKNISWDLGCQVRFDHDISTFKSSYISTGLGYKLNKYVSFDLSYRYATNQYRDLHRFSGSVILTYKYKKFEMNLRNMYQNEREYFNNRYEKGHEPQNAIRERLQLSYSIKKSIKPYISAEQFFRIYPNRIDPFRLRLIAGVDFKIKKLHTLGIAYMYQPNFPTTQVMQAITLEYTYEIPSWKKIKKAFNKKDSKQKVKN